MVTTLRFIQIISVFGIALLVSFKCNYKKAILSYLCRNNYEALKLSDPKQSSTSLFFSTVFYLIVYLTVSYMISRKRSNIGQQYREELSYNNRAEVTPLLDAHNSIN